MPAFINVVYLFLTMKEFSTNSFSNGKAHRDLNLVIKYYSSVMKTSDDAQFCRNKKTFKSQQTPMPFHFWQYSDKSCQHSERLHSYTLSFFRFTRKRRQPLSMLDGRNGGMEMRTKMILSENSILKSTLMWLQAILQRSTLVPCMFLA